MLPPAITVADSTQPPITISPFAFTLLPLPTFPFIYTFPSKSTLPVENVTSSNSNVSTTVSLLPFNSTLIFSS